MLLNLNVNQTFFQIFSNKKKIYILTNLFISGNVERIILHPIHA